VNKKKTVSRGGVGRAQYSWPSADAVPIISSIGRRVRPFECRVARRAARRESPPTRSRLGNDKFDKQIRSRPAPRWSMTLARSWATIRQDCNVGLAVRSGRPYVQTLNDVGGVAYAITSLGSWRLRVLCSRRSAQRYYRGSIPTTKLPDDQVTANTTAKPPYSRRE